MKISFDEVPQECHKVKGVGFSINCPIREQHVSNIEVSLSKESTFFYKPAKVHLLNQILKFSKLFSEFLAQRSMILCINYTSRLRALLVHVL